MELEACILSNMHRLPSIGNIYYLSSIVTALASHYLFKEACVFLYILRDCLSLFAFYCCDKHRNQNQVEEEESVIPTDRIQSIMKGS